MCNSGLFHPYKWSYGPHLIAGRGALLVAWLVSYISLFRFWHLLFLGKWSNFHWYVFPKWVWSHQLLVIIYPQMHREKHENPIKYWKKKSNLGFIQWCINQLNGRMCLFRDCRRTFCPVVFVVKLKSESCRKLREIAYYTCVFQRKMNQFRWLRWFQHIEEYKLECENHQVWKVSETFECHFALWYFERPNLFKRSGWMRDCSARCRDVACWR